MNKYFIQTILYISLLAGNCGAIAQILPPDRRVEWERSGLADNFPEAQVTLDIQDYGADPTGQTATDTALRQAIDALNGSYGVINFPAGTYLFQETVELKDSIVLKGDGAQLTTLEFDLGGEGHLIDVQGAASGSYELAASAASGDDRVFLNNAQGLQAGDFIRVYQDDEALIASDWARRSTGQMNQIVALTDEGALTLAEPLRMNYDLALTPAIEKINPVKGVVISCLKIERNDVTEKQTSNIHFRYATGCQVQGVESNRCNFSHIRISYSYRLKISGSYFHHAFSYGSGGKAYGVVAQYSTGGCLVENNIFERLRHAMLVQAGANGNVFAYNYSTDPFWEGSPSPSDAAGDLVLHGNYPYANLFEGNIVQNMVIDDSHKNNGPINTLFRNRAESYGFIMFPNPPSDRQNIVGNDIPNLESSRGFFITFGVDHLFHGNLHKNEVIPANTTTVADTSYYLNEKPGFLGNYPWPAIGLPHPPNLHSIPARDRHLKGDRLTLCGDESPIVTGFDENGDKGPDLRVYPNPTTGLFTLDIGQSAIMPALIEVSSASGRVVHSINTTKRLNKINLSPQPPGLYTIKIFSTHKAPANLKVIIY